MTALWCHGPAFNNLDRASETHQPIYSYYFDYLLLCLPFKGPCRTLGIYFR